MNPSVIIFELVPNQSGLDRLEQLEFDARLTSDCIWLWDMKEPSAGSMQWPGASLPSAEAHP